MAAIHKNYGRCSIISRDGKYCLIKFLDTKNGMCMKRVNARLIEEFPDDAFSHKQFCLCTYNRMCPYCRIWQLKKWAKEIERLKNEISQALSLANLQIWNAMNSQRKKLAVFRAIELRFITWKIESRNSVKLF